MSLALLKVAREMAGASPDPQISEVHTCDLLPSRSVLHNCSPISPTESEHQHWNVPQKLPGFAFLPTQGFRMPPQESGFLHLESRGTTLAPAWLTLHPMLPQLFSGKRKASL